MQFVLLKFPRNLFPLDLTPPLPPLPHDLAVPLPGLEAADSLLSLPFPILPFRPLPPLAIVLPPLVAVVCTVGGGRSSLWAATNADSFGNGTCS